MTGAKQEVINSQQSPEGQASRFANVPLTESVRALYLHKTKPALTGTDSIASVIFEDFLDAGTVGTELTGSADKREIREALLRYKQIDSMANGVAVCQAIGRLFFLRELIQSYEASTDQLMLFFALKTLIDRSLVQAEELGITEEVVSQVAHAQYAARAEAGGQTPLEQTLAEQVWRQWVRREELDAPASVSFNARISADHNLDITLDLSQNLPGQIAQTVERYAQYLATADELVYPGFSAIAVCVYAVMQSAGWNVPMRKIGFRSDGSSPKGTIDLWQLRTEARHYYQQFPESIETSIKPEAARAKRVVLIGSRHGISEAQKQELAALEGLEVADMVFVPFDTGHVDP
ncbi:hypothetical protein KBC79_00165, partial [Candidatus Woesebacteria bacterium]|nr:hypothetical protein [Candidatus Woesebacteria bacterium]